MQESMLKNREAALQEYLKKDTFKINLKKLSDSKAGKVQTKSRASKNFTSTTKKKLTIETEEDRKFEKEFQLLKTTEPKLD
jgi:hypothetical protein